jgi:hypothetical protein
MKQAEGALSSFGRHSTQVMGTIRRFAGLALGGWGVYRVARAFADTANQLNEIGNAAERLGIGAEAFTSLKLAAELAHVEFGALTKSVQKMLVTIGGASRNKAMGKFFSEDLKLSLEELNTLQPDQMFLRIAAAIKKIPTTSGQAKAAQRIFGKGTYSIMGFLRLSDEEMKSLMGEAKRLGVAFSDLDLKMIGRGVQSWKRMRTVIEGIRQRIVIDLIPAVEILFDGITDWFVKHQGPIDDWLAGLSNTLLIAADAAWDLADATAAVAKPIGSAIGGLRDRGPPRKFVRQALGWWYGTDEQDVKNMWPDMTGKATAFAGRIRTEMAKRIIAAKAAMAGMSFPGLGGLSELAGAGAGAQTRYTFGLATAAEFPKAAGGIAAYAGESRIMKKIEALGETLFTKLDNLTDAVYETGDLE